MAKLRSFLPSVDALQKKMFHWEDAGFQERSPALYEFLATAQVAGEERRGGSVQLFCANGQWKVCFLDKHTQLAFYATLDPARELLSQLEAMLISPPEPWHSIKKENGKVPF